MVREWEGDSARRAGLPRDYSSLVGPTAIIQSLKKFMICCLVSLLASSAKVTLLAVGGAPTLFVVFAAFFVVAAVAAWGLVDRRGMALDDR